MTKTSSELVIVITCGAGGDANPCLDVGGWHHTRQFIVGETQSCELRQEPKLGWKGARELVVIDPQTRELGQETELRWKGTRQFVVGERQPPQLD